MYVLLMTKFYFQNPSSLWMAWCAAQNVWSVARRSIKLLPLPVPSMRSLSNAPSEARDICLRLTLVCCARAKASHYPSETTIGMPSQPPRCLCASETYPPLMDPFCRQPIKSFQLLHPTSTYGSRLRLHSQATQRRTLRSILMLRD